MNQHSEQQPAKPLRLRALVAAEEPRSRTSMVEGLWMDGHEVTVATNEGELLGILWAINNAVIRAPEVVVVDLAMIASDGADALARMHEAFPGTTFMSIAERGDYRSQVTAIRLDGLLFAAPVDVDDLRVVIGNVARQSERKHSIRRFRRVLDSSNDNSR